MDFIFIYPKDMQCKSTYYVYRSARKKNLLRNGVKITALWYVVVQFQNYYFFE